MKSNTMAEYEPSVISLNIVVSNAMVICLLVV